MAFLIFWRFSLFCCSVAILASSLISSPWRLFFCFVVNCVMANGYYFITFFPSFSSDIIQFPLHWILLRWCKCRMWCDCGRVVVNESILMGIQRITGEWMVLGSWQWQRFVLTGEWEVETSSAVWIILRRLWASQHNDMTILLWSSCTGRESRGTSLTISVSKAHKKSSLLPSLNWKELKILCLRNRMSISHDHYYIIEEKYFILYVYTAENRQNIANNDIHSHKNTRVHKLWYKH